MPCILKIRVIEARDLPVMDRSSELADAYVEIKFGDISEKTVIRRKTLDPIWNEDFRFEVTNDALLQDIPIELKVWDYDVVSANDIIGIVYVDLNSLLMPDSSGLISGWFPIYDTLKGTRGELNITIKLEFFGNVNEFKDASAGVMFFSTSAPLSCYSIEQMQGFVEELILDDDPEYYWIDSFRASRISNEERQLLLYNLSGKLRRHLGKKVLDLGGNSVLAYHQDFDLEGENGQGIVARGYGTACLLRKNSSTDAAGFSAAIGATLQSFASPPKRSFLKSEAPISVTPPSEPTILNRAYLYTLLTSLAPGTQSKRIKSQDIQLLTLRNFQLDSLHRFGGVVMARSVKLLSSKSNQETRDAWWQEVREEVQSHARFLGCNCVIGYTETNAIERKEGLCVLTVSGTAAVLTNSFFSVIPETVDQDSTDDESKKKKKSKKIKKKKKKREVPSCTYCHIPYHKSMAPFNMKFVRCGVCRKGYVPEILLTTIDCPQEINITGQGVFLEARVCRAKKRAQGEQNAIVVSETIPFLEYDLHRQILYKLKVLGMNAAFCLKYQLAISESLIVGVASATAVFLPGLPAPPMLHINRNLDSSDKSLLDVQHRIEELSKQNVQSSKPLSPKEDTVASPDSKHRSSSSSDDSSEEDEKSDEETSTFVVQVDDGMDEDTISVLLEPSIPTGFSFCNTEILPRSIKDATPLSNVQLLTAIRRVELEVEPKRLNQQFSAIFHQLYSSIMFKLRSLAPCYICCLNADLQLPDENEVQIVLTGMVTIPITIEDLQLDTQEKSSDTEDSELQFTMDFSSINASSKRRGSDTTSSPSVEASLARQFVELTPMGFIPGAQLTKCVGRVNLHFIKESFTLREQGGLAGFTHVFLNEINALVRSHVAALGGNVLLGYRIDECSIMENDSKNQSYSLISISGDAFVATPQHSWMLGIKKLVEVSSK